MFKIAIIAISTIIVAFILLNIFSIVKTDLNKPPAQESDDNENIEFESEAQDVEELSIQTLVEGSGEGAKDGDTLSVHYTGSLLDGTVFDSSLNRGEPFTLTLGAGGVIQGWEQGLQGIKLGEKRLITIPSYLGYGESEQGEIPPNAALKFEVELIEFVE